MATAIAGSAVVGAISANKAASTQADAASKAGDLSKQISDSEIALAREQFNAQALNQEPFRQAGLAAQNQLMKLLGLKMPTGQTANFLSTTTPAGGINSPNLTEVSAQTADEKIKANWDEAAYLKAHPDVAAELSTGKSASGQNTLITSGYDHFLKYGQNAGYQPTLTAAPGLTTNQVTTPKFTIAQPKPVITTTKGPELSRVKGTQINTTPTFNGLSYALNNGLTQAQYDKQISDAFVKLEAKGYTDSMFRSEMESYGVSPEDLARALGADPAAVAARYAAATPKTAAEIAFHKSAMADLASRQASDTSNFTPDTVTYGPSVTKTTQGVNTTPSLADVQKYFQDNPNLSDSQIKTLLARESIPIDLLAKATNLTVQDWGPRLDAAKIIPTSANYIPSVAEIQKYAQDNPNLTWTQIQQFMQTNKITPELMSQALSVPVADINAKIAQANAPKAVNLSNSTGLNYALKQGLSQAQYDAEIKDFVVKNQGKLSNSMLKSEMDRFGITTADMARATGGDLATIQSIYDTSKATTPEEISYEKAAQADLLKRQEAEAAAAAQESATDFGALTKPFEMRMGSTTPGEQGAVFDPGTLLNNFTQADFEADPGYAFRFSEGQKALDKSMAARGLGVSGANIKGAVKYGQDMGSQEYNNAFNRFQLNRTNQSDVYNTAFNRDQVQRNALLNPLQSLMGAGQSATNQVNSASNAFTNNVTSASNNYGTNATNALTGGANARASGYVGTANALTNAVGQGINYNNIGSQNALYSSMFNNSGTTVMNPALNSYFQPSG